MVSGLEENRVFRSLQGILTEVRSIVGGVNRRDERGGRNHKRPIGERNEEAMPIHIHEVGHVTASCEEETQITHSLRSINLALLSDLLFLRKVLQTSKLVVLIRIGLRRYVVDVVRPVLKEVFEINGLVRAHSVRFIITVLTIIKSKSSPSMISLTHHFWRIYH